MLPKDSGCIGIIDRTRSFPCLLAFLYSIISGLPGLMVAMPGSLFVSRAMRLSAWQHATIADCKTFDVESGFVTSFLTAVVGLGMPTVRFGISSTTSKIGTCITNGTAPRSNRTAPYRTTQSTDLDHQASTMRPYTPGNSRWSARNLTQKRRKMERQGPSIAAGISCSMYPQRKFWSYGHGSDAAYMHVSRRRRETRPEGLQAGEQPRQAGSLDAACNITASTDHCLALYFGGSSEVSITPGSLIARRAIRASNQIARLSTTSCKSHKLGPGPSSPRRLVCSPQCKYAMSPTEWAGQRQTKRHMRQSLRALQVPARADEALGSLAFWRQPAPARRPSVISHLCRGVPIALMDRLC
jgi:hypothetical protein